MTIWEKVREEFPVCKKYVYLNPAGGSPVSASAANEAKRFYDEMLEAGDNYYEECLNRVEEIRSKLARYISASKEEIAFTTNTSHGMNLIAQMLKDKGTVLTMRDEFPSSTYPWLNQKVSLKMVDPVDGCYPIENIEAAITPDVRVLMTSYIQYCTGFKQDLKAVGELCKKHNLIFVVNATQAMPVFPVDVEACHIDFLVFTGLKWATAGYGIGGLYVRKKWLDLLQMPFAGWLSTEEPESMENLNLQLRKDASVMEAGCPHFAPIFALGGALSLFTRLGQEEVTLRVLELTDYLQQRLKELGADIASPKKADNRSGISIVKTDNANELVALLKKKNIIISARGEGIRISVNIFNNKEDIDKLISELSHHLML